MMTLETYKKALKAHDWYYAYADGYTDYVNGRDQRYALHEMARKVDPDSILWNEVAPDQFKIAKK